MFWTWQVSLDPTPFIGLESVADAVEHLHSGRSVGKVNTSRRKLFFSEEV
jgi:hypothetical protein